MLSKGGKTEHGRGVVLRKGKMHQMRHVRSRKLDAIRRDAAAGEGEGGEVRDEGVGRVGYVWQAARVRRA